MGRPVIFLDDGGVMNDNSMRGPQWQRLVAEFFVPRLGGTYEAWAKANHIVASAMLEPAAWSVRLQAASGYADFDRAYQIDWLAEMCRLVGVPCPSDDDCYELALRANAYIIPRVRSAFPGAVEAILHLYQEGYTLHTASGESSSDLNYYLEGMGVRHCFGRLYGPDLINTFKEGKQGRQYYERMLDDAGIGPEDALVVDDNVGPISWAKQAGVRTVLVGNRDMNAESDLRIQSLAELPELLEQLDR
jgi:phosphoglycolate phosphatase-like HAD superfamily hydrolase